MDFIGALPIGSGFALQVRASPKKRDRCGLSASIPNAGLFANCNSNTKLIENQQNYCLTNSSKASL